MVRGSFYLSFVSALRLRNENLAPIQRGRYFKFARRRANGTTLDRVKLVPTRRTDYAIRSLLFLAHQNGSSAKAIDIGAAMDIPKGFLHQVLQELQRAGLVTSRSGPNGGYALAQTPEDITIRHIVEALEGALTAQECALRGGPCHWDNVCALHDVWASAQQSLVDVLSEATLAQVAADDLALAAGTKPIPANTHRRYTP